MVNLWRRFRAKTAGLTFSEAAEEVAQALYRRLLLGYRQLRAALVEWEISDSELLSALNVSSKRLFEHFCQEERVSITALCKETAEEFKRRFPEAVEELVSLANAVCEHEFDFLGRHFSYPGEIDWHYDPSSGYRWQVEHYSRLSTQTGILGVDIKLLWELARMQHTVTLAQAWLLTDNERYAGEYCWQIRSFVHANPLERGIHWLCPMELGIRAVNLAVSFQVLCRSQSFDLETLKAFLKLMLSHGLHIERNLEYSPRLTSNHYLCNLLGLLWIGGAFPEFKYSRRWVEFALAEFKNEMRKQVYDDGGDWEASTSYHALVLEVFLYAYLLCRQRGLLVEEWQWRKLAKMLDYLKGYLRPDLRAPLIGDCDDGRILTWRRYSAQEQAHLLALGAVCLSDASFKLDEYVGRQEVLWVFGKQGLEDFESMPTSKQDGSVAFPNSGLYVMRYQDDYCAVDCGDVGIEGRGSHAHNDVLSLELMVAGRAFLVDPGSYVYTSDVGARNRFRSTAYHNTARVDGQEQNTISTALFVIGNEAEPRVLRWESRRELDLLEAEHYGYANLGVVHRRLVVFDKIARRWNIEDRFNGSGEHLYEIFFRFAPEVSIAINGLTIKATNEVSIEIAAEGEGLSLSLLEAEVSPSYGVKLPSKAVVYSARKYAPYVCLFAVSVIS
ncbi:MAG: alginate lyase family protein [Acidobacteriota bacterium]|nr:heparinase II/III family protein [Blastocatellia bacterium]MDW8411184.1 alginate lyase family protein [Acidobacteriota bacterium]